MKVSLNWAQAFSNVDLKALPKDELVKKIGLQLGAVEEVIDYGIRFKDIVVARVVRCEDHPDADRLHVCLVDDGGATENIARNDQGFVQVVCGAPNVREGMLVAWLPPGSAVPVSHDEKVPFVLGARELRGVISNGMLASSKELGLSNDHEGILEITEDIAPGTAFSTLYDLDDTIVDCENKMFTHRPDCFGILGVARELAGIQQQAFRSPAWYIDEPSFDSTDRLPIEVRVETDMVPRFMAVSLDDVTVKASPVWLQSALARVGIKSINNVVDVTNYVMHLTAQPLHAYDYDKIAARSESTPTLIARTGNADEKVSLLNGKSVGLDADTVVIAADKEVVGIAGIMGGSDTEVDETTTRIILEVASFDMYNVRRSSMKYGLFTDAVTRFNKGQSSRQNDRVLAYALQLLNEIAGASQASAVHDVYPVPVEARTMKVSASFVNNRLGSELDANAIAMLLRNVEFVTEVDGDTVVISVPFWRQDIEYAEDVVEEIGRLYGFDRLPVSLPMRSVEPVALDALFAFKKKIRTIMAAGGANEVLTYNFVHGKLFDKVGQHADDAFKLRNALSPELQYYRLSLTPSLLSLVHPNIKAGHDEFMIYELGKCHNKQHLNDENLPEEFNVFAGVYAAKKSATTSFYQAKKYLDYVASQCGISLRYTPLREETAFPVTKPFDLQRSALVSVDGTDIFLGIVGEYREEVIKNLKLPETTAGFEIGIVELLQATSNQVSYAPLSRYPGMTQDICFRVDGQLGYAELEKSIKDVLMLSDLETTCGPVDIYQEDGSDYKQITFRISMVDNKKTMTGDDANELIKKVTETVTSNLGATVI